jgi:hypothetical protein
MRNTKGFWIFLLVGSLIFSCNSPKRQKKINDGKLFEKLKGEKGYLNALELKRLEQDFSLKLLDKYDLSGFDEEDTLAYFVRSESHVWIATCYLGDEDSPFFCLNETKEKGFKVIKHGMIPAEYGECAYDLKKLVVLTGKYILISRKSNGDSYCEDSPVIFHADGKEIRKVDNQFQVITRNCFDQVDGRFCFERDFSFESKQPGRLVVHIHEKKIDEEAEQEVSSRNIDLGFAIKNNTIYFQDTIYK